VRSPKPPPAGTSMRRPAEGFWRMLSLDNIEFLHFPFGEVPEGMDLGSDIFRVMKMQLF
jgi:hypothetical protein